MRLRDELTSTRIELINKKEELMQMRDNLFSVQKTLSEKEILFQEANDHLAEQIPKSFSESEVLGGVSGLEKDNSITSSETTSKKKVLSASNKDVNTNVKLHVTICPESTTLKQSNLPIKMIASESTLTHKETTQTIIDLSDDFTEPTKDVCIYVFV
ncbi:hypothetical protein RhiirA1_479947 [Rhizophagus irregularis]|uniref:Uncharacterized protein n=1 Tax=Rhizophagus irregularis TaxID=588596 RepID=A0A2I1FDE3_9GLOM|nr:hypothetical protein RhiirA1_479947 [Rhizophagus irregularis]PKY32394.1 hypothetical protein RhiirB3_450553 [Rhizophagus irregularis]